MLLIISEAAEEKKTKTHYRIKPAKKKQTRKGTSSSYASQDLSYVNEIRAF